MRGCSGRCGIARARVRLLRGGGLESDVVGWVVIGGVVVVECCTCRRYMDEVGMQDSMGRWEWGGWVKPEDCAKC